MRRFNVTGLCIPEEDYMVDISGKIKFDVDMSFNPAEISTMLAEYESNAKGITNGKRVLTMIWQHISPPAPPIRGIFCLMQFSRTNYRHCI